jgi:hypothetical protein
MSPPDTAVLLQQSDAVSFNGYIDDLQLLDGQFERFLQTRRF